MENMPEPPTAAQASAALDEAEASRARLAHGIATPSWFFASLSAAIAAQIALTALGLSAYVPHSSDTAFDDGALWATAAGVAIFVVVAGVQLVRFRRRNGIWLGGFASRVVLGTGMAASASYVLALGLAIWAAFDVGWWLAALCSIAGGAGYGLSGRRWMRTYRAQPAVHSRGESAAWIAVLAVAALAGLALLVIKR